MTVPGVREYATPGSDMQPLQGKEVADSAPSLPRRGCIHQHRVAYSRTLWDDNRELPLPRRGCITQPRVTYSRTLGGSQRTPRWDNITE